MVKKCIIVGCNKPAKGRMLCWSHYARQRRIGSVNLPDEGNEIYMKKKKREKTKKICKGESCTKEVVFKGYCIDCFNDEVSGRNTSK